MTSCPLCPGNFRQKTKWYHEDDDFVIADCLTCLAPMVVMKEHVETETDVVIQAIAGKCVELFPDFGGFKKDVHGTGKPHLQWHIIRDKNGS